MLGGVCDSVLCSCGQRLARGARAENTQLGNPVSSDYQNIALFGNLPPLLTLANAQIENGQIMEPIEPIDLEQAGYAAAYGT